METISSISREYGLTRSEVRALIVSHEIPTDRIGPSTVVSGPALRKLRSLCEKLADAKPVAG